MTPCPCPQRQSWLCPQDWIPPENLIYSPLDCCVEACASLRSRTVWRVRAHWRVHQKSRGMCPIQSYLEARGQKQTTVHSETHMCFPFSNSSILHFCNKMYSCYLVKRAPSRESGDCRFLWISEVFCLISLLIQSRIFPLMREYLVTPLDFCYWIWREAQWAIKTKSKRRYYVMITCHNHEIIVHFLSVCLSFVITY